MILTSLALMTSGAALADSPDEPGERGPDYCVVIAPSQMPPVAVDPENCKLPPERGRTFKGRGDP